MGALAIAGVRRMAAGLNICTIYRLLQMASGLEIWKRQWSSEDRNGEPATISNSIPQNALSTSTIHSPPVRRG